MRNIKLFSIKLLVVLWIGALLIDTTHAQTNDKMILKSLSAAYEVPVAGMYQFQIGDVVFETYVDDRGNILVVNDFGDDQGVLKQLSKLSLTDRGILSKDVVMHLGQLKEVIIVVKGDDVDSFMATSNTKVIKKLKSYETLHSGKVDNAIHQSWTGSGAKYLNPGAYCNSKSGRTLDSNIVDVCGNTNGMKWSPLDSNRQLVYKEGGKNAEQSIQLWVNGKELSAEKAKEDIEYLNTVVSVHHDKILKSLKAASKVSEPGIYQFKIKGESFSTVVDEKGYVLVAKDNNAYSGPLSRVRTLDDTIRGVLVPSALKSLRGIHQVRISNRDLSFDVNSYYENIIDRVEDYQDLSDYTSEQKSTMMKQIWSGNNKKGVNEMPFCGSSRPIYSLDSAIYDACFTKNALVWSPMRDKKTIRFKSKKNESELNLWVSSKNSHNKINKIDKKVKYDNEHRNQVLSLKIGLGFSDGLPVELGLAKVVPLPVDAWGGEVPWASSSLGVTYMRNTLSKHSFYQGFNADADISGLIFNARMRWTSAFDDLSNSAHYITPAIGLGLIELFQLNFNYRIPIKENNFSLNKFYVSISAAIPLFGGRFD